jgi:large subunit ribosomal protein L22
MKAQATAYQKFIHQTPRKLRLVADALRGQKINHALDILRLSPKRASEIMHKIVTQAKSNANNNQITPDTLIIKEIVVEEGPRIKRWRPVSRGMAHSIIKRTSHVKVAVEGELVEETKPVSKPNKGK